MAKGIRLGFDEKLAQLKEKLDKSEKQQKAVQDTIKQIKSEISNIIAKETIRIANDDSLSDEQKLEKLKLLKAN